MRVSTVSAMRGLDRTAIEQCGIIEELLMENAGQAVYFVLLDEFGIEGKRFLVFCGLGNNGGDGFVVARKIHSNGGSVKVFVLGDPSRFRGAARTNFDIVSRLPIAVQRLESGATVEADLTGCDAVVDAILGTGITRGPVLPQSGWWVFSPGVAAVDHALPGQQGQRDRLSAPGGDRRREHRPG